MKSTPYTFTITNTCDLAAAYDVNLEALANTTFKSESIKVGIDGKSRLYTNFSTSEKYHNDSKDSRKIASGILNHKNDSVTYNLRLWIDSKVGNDEQNKKFDAKIIVTASVTKEDTLYAEAILNGADPVLADNLIPVTIDNDGTVHKADTSKEWYNYENKEWANAVILNDWANLDDYATLTNENKVHGAVEQDGGVYFDGVDDYIDLGLENYDFGSAITMAIRVKFKDDSISQEFFMNEEYGGLGFTIETNKKILIDFFNISKNKYEGINSQSTMLLDTDYLLVATYDGEKLKLYINGILDSELTTSGNIKSSSMPFLLGANPQPSGNHKNYSNITIYETAIFNRALSESEITQNYSKVFNIQNDNGLLSYKNFSKNTISENKIESYFVWIPKYSYQLWDLGNYNEAINEIPTTANNREIQIKFGTNNTSDANTGECTTPMTSGESGNCIIGDWMTHPAFISMNTTGLWVAKFETTGSISTLRSKPNETSLRNQTLSTMWDASYNYQRDLDSHMMKNTEWGAVAYLSHSKYGLNNEVRINNNSNYITGYSSVDGVNQSIYPGINGTTLDKTQPYNTETGYKASTTGNITGIYDMSGGAHEYMSSYVSGNVGTSEFNDSTIGTYNIKYFDIYSLSSDETVYKNRILGDATGEIGPFYYYQDSDNIIRYHGWYGDISYFVYTSYPWFYRGGTYNDGLLAGQFYFNHYTGNSHIAVGFRLVLSPQ